LEDYEEVIVTVLAFIAIALFVGVFVYVWMASAGLPTIIAAPIGVVSFLVIIAALFGIAGVVIAAIKVIGELLD